MTQSIQWTPKRAKQWIRFTQPQTAQSQIHVIKTVSGDSHVYVGGKLLLSIINGKVEVK